MEIIIPQIQQIMGVNHMFNNIIILWIVSFLLVLFWHFFKVKIIEYYLNKAKKLDCEDSVVDAIKCLDKVLIIDKNNVDALCRKGFCYAMIFDERNSFECFEKAIKIQPSNLHIYFDWGLACGSLDKHDMSIKYFKKILKYFPDDLDLLINIGMSYLRWGNVDEALKYLNRALSKKEQPRILCLISNCYRELEDYEKSLEYIDKALELDNNYWIAYKEKSIIYINMNDFNRALDCIDRVLEINKDPFNLLEKYYILAELKDYKNSLEGFKNISLKMESHGVVEGYYCYYAKALACAGKYDKALELYEEYFEKYPHFPKDNVLKEKDEVLKLLRE